MKWIFYIFVFNFIHLSIQSDSVTGILLLLLNFTMCCEDNFPLDGHLSIKWLMLQKLSHLSTRGVAKTSNFNYPFNNKSII
jgi:hypothetical protein